MYKRVDTLDQDVVTGFSYENREGEEEVVLVENRIHATVSDADGNTAYIYYEDIPNLIKALQAAYDFKQGK